MHPLTTPEYIIEDYEAQALALALDFALSFPLSLRFSFCRTTAAKTSPPSGLHKSRKMDPPKNVLLGDFSKSLYFVKKEFDGEGPEYATVEFQVNISEIAVGQTMSGMLFFTVNGQMDVIYLEAFDDGTDYDLVMKATIQYPAGATITNLHCALMINNNNILYSKDISVVVPANKKQVITLVAPLSQIEDPANSDGRLYGIDGQEDCEVAGMRLNYFGARYYDPEVGIWGSLDPKLEYWNGYSYVGSQPTSFVDPNGQTSKNWKRFWRTVGVFAADIASGGVLSVTAGATVAAGVGIGWTFLDYNDMNYDPFTGEGNFGINWLPLGLGNLLDPAFTIGSGPKEDDYGAVVIDGGSNTTPAIPIQNSNRKPILPTVDAAGEALATSRIDAYAKAFHGPNMPANFRSANDCMTAANFIAFGVISDQKLYSDNYYQTVAQFNPVLSVNDVPKTPAFFNIDYQDDLLSPGHRVFSMNGKVWGLDEEINTTFYYYRGTPLSEFVGQYYNRKIRGIPAAIENMSYLKIITKSTPGN